MPTLRSLSVLALSLFSSLVTPAGCASTLVVPDEQATGYALGAACAFDAQCASSRCTGNVAEGTCGECVDPQHLGESCAGPHQGCSISAVCKDGVCRSTRKIVGEACTLGPKNEDNGDCDVDLYCAHGDWMNPGECAARVAVGEACDDYPENCVVGAFCNAAQRCAVPVPGMCESYGSCGGGSYCDEALVCHLGTLAEGAPCGIVDGNFIDNACKPGLLCGSLEFPNGGGGPSTAESCLPYPGEGEPCIHEACSEGLFCKQSTDDSGTPPTCELLRGEGEACSNDNYYHVGCAAGLECRKDTCQIACR